MKLVALLVVLLLAGCTSDLARLRALTEADLQRAIEINLVADDYEGLQCGEGLLAIVQELHAREPIPEPIGVASAVAYARAVRLRNDDQDLLRRINLACAPAFVEATSTYTKLLIRLGFLP